MVRANFLISINKKHTSEAVHYFEYETNLDPNDNVDSLFIRQLVASRACESGLVPAEYGSKDLRPEYWIESICID